MRSDPAMFMNRRNSLAMGVTHDDAERWHHPRRPNPGHPRRDGQGPGDGGRCQINLNRQNALAGALPNAKGRRSRRGSGRAERTSAQFDPNASLVQQNRLWHQAQQQDIEFSAEKCRCCATKASAGRCRP